MGAKFNVYSFDANGSPIPDLADAVYQELEAARPAGTFESEQDVAQTVLVALEAQSIVNMLSSKAALTEKTLTRAEAAGLFVCATVDLLKAFAELIAGLDLSPTDREMVLTEARAWVDEVSSAADGFVKDLVGYDEEK